MFLFRQRLCVLGLVQPLQLMRAHMVSQVIDLHGLHVAEGVEAVVAGNRSGAFHQANNFGT
jgi:hypothetical protein